MRHRLDQLPGILLYPPHLPLDHLQKAETDSKQEQQKYDRQQIALIAEIEAHRQPQGRASGKGLRHKKPDRREQKERKLQRAVDLAVGCRVKRVQR